MRCYSYTKRGQIIIIELFILNTIIFVFGLSGLATISLASTTTTANATADASSAPTAATNSKNTSKRQINHQTRVAVAPINSAERLPGQVTQTIYGQHTPGQYISRPIQVDQDQQQQQQVSRQQQEVRDKPLWHSITISDQIEFRVHFNLYFD